MSKYRDRAAERRKGLSQADEADIKSRITAAYKAVPGTASAVASLAERRKLEIQVNFLICKIFSNFFNFRNQNILEVIWNTLT